MFVIGAFLYVPRKRKPTAAIAWLLIIFFLPFLGILLFFVIGSLKLSKRRRLLQATIDKRIQTVASGYKEATKYLTADQIARYTSTIDLARNLTHLPLTSGNKVAILPEYNKAIADITASINGSKEFVHLEYFILALDESTQPIFDAMGAAVKRGVKVRVLFDALCSSGYPRKREMRRLLTDMGVEWHFILPISFKPKSYNRPDLRNHRKIVVIDDAIAYIGSQNMIDRTYHRKDDIYYDELVAKIAGPAVRECASVFASDWLSETGQRLNSITDPKLRPMPKNVGDTLVQILPSGSNYEQENNALLFTELIHKANKKLVITNPYFVPSEAILNAVKTAAIRGVDITIINSEAMDQWMVGHAMRSFYK